VEHRQLGDSGVATSVVAFGCGPGAGLMITDDVQLQVEAVRVALDGGIDMFDTAAAYGDGRSETFLGRALKIVGARPKITSKVLITDDQLGDIKGATFADVEASLRRLKVDNLEVLMLHNRVARYRDPGRVVGIGPLLSVDDVLGSGGYAEAVAELKRNGVVRAAGYTTFGGQPDAIDEIAWSSVFDAINADFSPGNPSAGYAVNAPGMPNYHSVIDRARAAGLSTMAIQVLGNGRLIRSDVERSSIETNVAAWLTAKTGDVVSGAIRFVLSKPGVSSAVIGFSHPHHVRDAIAAAEAGSLPPRQVRELCRLHVRNEERLMASNGNKNRS
jgi:aryl-alcohol dehydrogenase-like predicted oxidoreductase